MEDSASISEICKSVHLLNKLAGRIRSQRFENGSLQLNQVRPHFSLSETGFPIGLSPYIQKPANRLIEEWMLAANEAVATLLAERLPHTAFLRRHPSPTTKQIKEAQILLKSIGVDVKIDTAGDLQSSLCRLSGNPINEGWNHSDELVELCASMISCNVTATISSAPVQGKTNTLTEEAHMLATLNLLTKCMNLAEYFCLGMLDENSCHSHYALNIENYTHFTSPIRRYADVVVHRQLAAILSENAEKASVLEVAEAYKRTSTWSTLSNPNELTYIADHCNTKKQDGRRASEDSAEVFFTIFVKECGPLQEACSVVNVLSHSFDVLLLSTGIVKRVYLNRLDLKSFEYEGPALEIKNVSGTGVLYLEWNVRPAGKGEEKKMNEDETINKLSFDPAICRAIPAGSNSSAILIGRNAVTAQQNTVAPCRCFSTKISLFGVCRSLISVSDENTANPINASIGEESSSLLGESNQLPKLVVTILRPTCELCEDYA